jgi:hypothetical protein
VGSQWLSRLLRISLYESKDFLRDHIAGNECIKKSHVLDEVIQILLYFVEVNQRHKYPYCCSPVLA